MNLYHILGVFFAFFLIHSLNQYYFVLMTCHRQSSGYWRLRVNKTNKILPQKELIFHRRRKSIRK